MKRSFYKCSTPISLVIISATLLLLSSIVGLCADTATLPQDSQPVWSPDGRQIAFVSNRLGTSATGAAIKNIWVIHTDGSGLRQLTTDGTSDSPTWSPDGKNIGYRSGLVLHQLEVKTAQVLQMTQGGKGWFSPDWHPKDANKMLCAARLQVFSDNDIFVLNPQTCLTRSSGRQIVREREGADERPKWSPDGKNIAFVGEVINREYRDSKWFLMTIRPDGTGLKTYCEVSNRSARPTWFSDCTAVMIDGGKVCELATCKVSTPFTDPIQDPDISTDGKMVAYSASVPDKGRFIFTMKLNGTDKKQITLP